MISKGNKEEIVDNKIKTFQDKSNETFLNDKKIVEDKVLNKEFYQNINLLENEIKYSKKEIIYNIPFNKIERSNNEEKETKYYDIFKIPIDNIKNKSNEKVKNKKEETDFTSKDLYDEINDYEEEVEEEEEEEMIEEKPIFNIPIEFIKNEKKK